MKRFAVNLSLVSIAALNMLLSHKVCGQHIEGNQINQIRKTATKTNELVHTRLDVRFDFDKRHLYGKEWVTVRPYFYPLDSLHLNAKGMDIHNVSIINKGGKVPLQFRYDSTILYIQLDRKYKRSQTYTVFIDYTAKPYELGGNIRNDGRGLYFINPDRKEKNKPVQIWTQGQTTYNSIWFPTIDDPNQKTTQEISITVPSQYVTLSNGSLIKKEIINNKLRKDTWRMTVPHSPYLFMMAVGDFSVKKQYWRGKEVSYYLEPKYAQHADRLFGFTPEALEYFSNLLGVPYPWSKYAQIRVRDYVSGAMENTSATVYGEDGKVTAQELSDVHYYQSGAIHELFHQWFGNYVTAENWSNLTVNESFANFGEMLWAEYKLGQDAADERLHNWMNGYLHDSTGWAKPLVRFQYEQEQDLFDGITFSKGSCIISMLRNYLGKQAFNAGLQRYLKDNAFKNAEAHHVRLAMEAVSGKDLNWFFNQWYYGAGHPILDIRYGWDAEKTLQTVYIEQKQPGSVFKLPMSIDIYSGGKKVRYSVVSNNRSDTFTFKSPSKPLWVNVDGDKVVVAEKIDHKKLQEYVSQYQQGPLYKDRLEAIEAAIANLSEEAARSILLGAVNDQYHGLRSKAINGLNLELPELSRAVRPLLMKLALEDSSNNVRADAISALGKLKDSSLSFLFMKGLKSPSLVVQAACLLALSALNTQEAIRLAKPFENNSKGKVTEALVELYTAYGGTTEWPYVYEKFTGDDSPMRYSFTRGFAQFTGRVSESRYAQRGVNAIRDLVTKLRILNLAPRIIEVLQNVQTERRKLNDDATVKVVDEAINAIKDVVK